MGKQCKQRTRSRTSHGLARDGLVITTRNSEIYFILPTPDPTSSSVTKTRPSPTASSTGPPQSPPENPSSNVLPLSLAPRTTTGSRPNGRSGTRSATPRMTKRCRWRSRMGVGCRTRASTSSSWPQKRLARRREKLRRSRRTTLACPLQQHQLCSQPSAAHSLVLANAAAANVFIVTNVISIVIDIAAAVAAGAGAAASYRPFADAAAAPIGGPPASPGWG